MPVIVHHFASLDDALAAARFQGAWVTLDVPLPDYVPISKHVLLRFRVGRGRERQAYGRASVRAGRYRIELEGRDAEVVRASIERPAAQRRRYQRIPCSIPVRVQLPGGQSVTALVWQIAPGGAGLADLERGLPSGKVVRLDFEACLEGVPARVIWSVAPPSGGNAGLAFLDDPRLIERVLRLVGV